MKFKSIYKILVIFALIFTSNAMFAQEDYKAENEGWLVNLDEAYKQSKETGKPILANITGSDWCGWCKRLTKSVFVKPEFKKWADENVVLLEVDFPRRKKLPPAIQQQNRNIQQALKVSGYPTIWVFNLDKNDKGEFNIAALGKTGYRKTVAEFTGDVNRMLDK